MPDEFWVLTRVIAAGSDPYWDTCATICGLPEKIRSMVDLSRGVPYGWRLYKGKAAKRFLKSLIANELRWAREQEAKCKAGGLN